MTKAEKEKLREAAAELAKARLQRNPVLKNKCITAALNIINDLTGNHITPGGTVPAKEPIPVPKDPILKDE